MTKDYALITLRLYFNDGNKRTQYYGDRRRHTVDKARVRVHSQLKKYAGKLHWAILYNTVENTLMEHVNGTDL